MSQTFRNIHQILPALASGDAIGNQAIYLRALLRERGYDSRIFAGGWDAQSQLQCEPYRSYSEISHPDNLLIFHYSIGGEVNTFVNHLPDRKVMIYHNVTPGHFFRGFNEDIAQLCDDARIELKHFAGQMPVIAASPYNATEIAAIGFEVLGIVPPVVDLNRLSDLRTSTEAQNAHTQFGKRGTLDWLFVGRTAPNKCIHDIIKAFYFFHTFIEPKSRLLLMGGARGMEAYENWLHQHVTALSLEGAVVFAGHQPDGALAAFYEMADVYVSMSEHEGFCVPVIEAMQFGVPILAFNSTNLPHALGHAGVLQNHKNAKLTAELAYELCRNQDLRNRVIATQRSRVSAFAIETIQQNFFDCLAQLQS